MNALDARTGERRWTSATGSPIHSSPAVAGNTVYVGSGTTVYAFDAASGEQVWRYPTAERSNRPPLLSMAPSSSAAGTGFLYAIGGRERSMRRRRRNSFPLAPATSCQPSLLPPGLGILAAGAAVRYSAIASSRSGSEAWAPSWRTARPPTALPNRAASGSGQRRARPYASPAVKASPAPVVSTTSTGKAGISQTSVAVNARQPHCRA